MNSLNRFQCKRGQALALDATIACLLALLVLLVGINAVSSAASRAKEMQEQVSLESRAISIADFVIKEGAVFREDSAYGPIAHTHEIDEQRFNSLSFSSTCIELLNSGGHTVCSGKVCIKRPVILHSSMEAGFLVVCVK